LSIVTRIATLGLGLAMIAGGDTPDMVHAQTSSKILVMGSSGEPDTFVGGEGGLYGTAVVGNLIYGQPGLVGIDDLMRPEAELATDVPSLDNGEAVFVGDGSDQHLETTFHLRQNATFQRRHSGHR
jgi:ABC-type transport system substrate-binding protein